MKIPKIIKEMWNPKDEDIGDVPRWLVVFVMRFAILALAFAILLLPVAVVKTCTYKHTRTDYGSIHWDEHFIECEECSEEECENVCKDKCSPKEHEFIYLPGMNSTGCECICINLFKNCLFCEQNINRMEVSKWLRKAR